MSVEREAMARVGEADARVTGRYYSRIATLRKRVTMDWTRRRRGSSGATLGGPARGETAMAQIRQGRRSGTGRRPHWSFALGVACLLTTGLALVAPTPAAAAVNVVVNSVGDAPDATPGDGSCETATAGECTLRAAIEETNAIAGADTIGFAIPGSGVHRIAPLDVLPFLGQVTIDGYTQPGTTPNTLARGSNAVLQIELHGGAVPTVSDRFGLVVTAPGSVIRGLVINGYGNNGSAIYSYNAPGLVTGSGWALLFAGQGRARDQYQANLRTT